MTETNTQKEITSNFKYIAYYLIDHAIQCTNKRCLCRASTIQDWLSQLKDVFTDTYKIQEVEEALENTNK